MKGQQEQAYKLIRSEMPNYPWQIDLYELSISLAADLGSKAKKEGNTQSMDMYLNDALEVYQDVLNRVELLKNLPKGQNQGQEFGITKEISYAMGEIYFLSGEYQKSTAPLKPVVSDQMDDPLNRMIARYYLAALNLQKHNDQALLDKLVAKDQSEKQQIEALISSAVSH
jgi:hypothetical protein